MNSPLVSFCVLSYNQRRYLKAALEGALAQTYRPLEIVVSDDASTDGSWELIQEVVARYKESHSSSVRRHLSPPPAIVLNRNEANRGNLGNWEKICELAHGELLVKADGDDVSLPERTARIVAAWMKDGRKAFAVCHSGWQMGPKGEGYGRLRRVTAVWPLGAAMTYSSVLFKGFPRVGTDYERCSDDEVYTRRARMLGDVLEMPDRLVKYRIGVGATSTLWKIRNQVRFCNRDTLKTLDVLERDLDAIPEANRTLWREFLASERRRLTLAIRRLDEPVLAERIRLTRALWKSSAFSIASYLHLSFTMPKFLGDAMLFFYALLRNAYWRLQG